MPQLESGDYLIKSHVRDFIVGRALGEDKSLQPKRVVTVPDAYYQTWSVKSLGDGKYTLSIRGSPTGIIAGRVFAILLDSPEPEKWIVKQQARGGYTIESSDRRGGWVLPEQELYSQVAVRPLIIGPSEPPFFPPFELWDFIPANNY